MIAKRVVVGLVYHRRPLWQDDRQGGRSYRPQLTSTRQTAELKDDIEGLVDLGDNHGIKAEVRDE